MLEIRDIHVAVDGKAILKGLSLTVKENEVHAIMGPNGSGKSTLLGILSTLLQPSAGRVRYGTRTAEEWGDALRARIGVLVS